MRAEATDVDEAACERYLSDGRPLLGRGQELARHLEPLLAQELHRRRVAVGELTMVERPRAITIDSRPLLASPPTSDRGKDAVNMSGESSEVARNAAPY